jgi:predicted ATPase
MVGNLAGEKPVPEVLLTEIVSKTDGVPLYVEELTKAVLESGVLHETGDAYVLDGPLQHLSLPASLHDIMMARLDRHQPLKEVAQTAACIGREFSHGLLSAVWSRSEQELRNVLARLEEAELIFRRRGSPELQYAFKHALVRDAAHESLLKSKQHAIHARILTALEGASDTPPEILAQHATEAGCIEKAIDYWQSAAILAIARPAYQEAISRVKQALKLAESMPDDRAWPERRLQLMLLLGQATIPLRGYSHSETLDVFMRAQELVAAIDDTPLRFSVAYAMWVVYYVRGEHVKAFSVAQDICERAHRERSDRRMLSGLRSLGISQMILGDPVTAHDHFPRNRGPGCVGASAVARATDHAVRSASALIRRYHPDFMSL